MEAWQNLICVLTHEIMNSVTPLISLSSSASSLLDSTICENDNTDVKPDTGNAESDSKSTGADSPLVEINAESLQDIKGALDTISKRSEGLLHFVDNYRNLTRIPVPNFQVVHVSELFGRIEQLFSDRFHEKNIRFICSVEPNNLELTADPDLIEQVIINLFMNSIRALSETLSPTIKLVGKSDGRGGTMIQVVDNGHGIPEELLEKIFIPFFTTRKEGSGIGLSLSRQIMRAHKGGITVHSIPEMETVFTLKI